MPILEEAKMKYKPDDDYYSLDDEIYSAYVDSEVAAMNAEWEGVDDE